MTKINNTHMHFDFTGMARIWHLINFKTFYDKKQIHMERSSILITPQVIFHN